MGSATTENFGEETCEEEDEQEFEEDIVHLEFPKYMYIYTYIYMCYI